MRKSIVSGLALFLGATAGLVGVRTLGQDDRPEAPPSAKAAIAELAPPLPTEITDALQEHRYDAAVGPLSRLADDPEAAPDARAAVGLILGSARRLAGRLVPARDALRAAIEADTGGRWATKLRFELAAVEAASGRFTEAERLARDEVATLLDHGRKDRLASIFRGFALGLLEPKGLNATPDTIGAIALLEQARGLAKGDAMRARLLFRNHPGRAIGRLTPQGRGRLRPVHKRIPRRARSPRRAVRARRTPTRPG